MAKKELTLEEQEKEAARQKAIAEANKPKGSPEIEEDKPEEYPDDPPLPPELQAQADAIMRDDTDAKLDAAFAESQQILREAKAESAKAAVAKLEKIFHSHSPAAPNEHVLFGHADTKFTLGDLRALFSAR